jgi:hypothetical protein
LPIGDFKLLTRRRVIEILTVFSVSPRLCGCICHRPMTISGMIKPTPSC